MPKTSPKRNTEIDAMSEPYSDDESAHDDNDDEDADKRRRRAAKTFPRRKKTISKQTTSKQATPRVGGILAIIENEDDSHSQTDAESMTSRMTCEYEYHEANPVDYYSSNFPSLLGYLGPNASYKLKRTTKTNKQHSSLPRRGSMATSIDKTEAQYGTFADRMKKKNDALWTRIETVAKERMERYERHTLEMAAKIRKQRQEIQRRSVELLNKLALQEMRKKEDKIFASPHGRMWRHHRTMQRRAFSLEPMRHDKLDTVTQSPRSKFSAMIT